MQMNMRAQEQQALMFGASDWCCPAMDCEESHFQIISIKVLLFLIVLMDSNQRGIT